MKEFTLEANLKLLTLNRAFSTLRNGIRCKSREYVIFEKEIKNIMNPRMLEFKSFANQFNPYIHELHAELIQYTNELYTKDGKISKLSGDVGNMEKCLTDSVLKKVIDDSYIVKWEMLKLYREVKGFRLTLKIVERLQ